MFNSTLIGRFTVVLAAITVAASGADFEQALKRLPRGANAVLAADTDAIMQSAVARRLGWGQPDYAAAPINIPSETQAVVVAAQLDPLRSFHRSWEVAVLNMKAPTQVRSIARAERGYVDQIGGSPAALVPHGAYFLQIQNDVLGVLYPANRQAAARWIENQADRNYVAISQFLRSATKGDHHMLLALDLKDVPKPNVVKEQLKESALVTKSGLSANELSELILGVQGIALYVDFSETVNTRMEVVFDKAVELRSQAARELVLSAFQRFQVEIPGMENWKTRIVGKSIELSGQLNEGGLRRLMSWIEIPQVATSEASGAGQEQPKDPKAQASQTYYRSVDQLVADLKSATKSHSNDAHWLERYAAKIDRLPILIVDKKLLKFGAQTAQTLRYMGTQKTQLKVQAANAVNYSVADSYYPGYGELNPEAVARIGSNSATSVKVEGFRLIANAQAEIRQKMTERYQLEF